MVPDSCDTFVVLADKTKNGAVIFGKNSDRPLGEVQEVVRVPRQKHPKGSTLRCTYVEIPQVELTHEMVLSKPAWLWGAEMGANEFGVAIGNEAVWNRLSDPEFDSEKRLIGMDLLRLGLERGKTASEALDVITTMLETVGQGGPCSEIKLQHTYHNSFLIADPNEAWVLETARHFWVAERVENGTRNISNCMSIGTKIDRMSSTLKEVATKEGWWNPDQGEFNWIEVIGEASKVPSTKLTTPMKRFCEGKRLLEEHSKEGKFEPKSMMTVLRHKDSAICRPYDPNYTMGNPTTGSLVSLLSRDPKERIHWLTGTADPSVSVFKPFKFDEKFDLELKQTSSEKPFPEKIQDFADRRHPLWSIHRKIESQSSKATAEEVGAKRLALENELMAALGSSVEREKLEQLGGLFIGSVLKEMDLYNALL